MITCSASLHRDSSPGIRSLYKSLSADANPEFATVLRVVEALGLKLHAAPASDEKAA